MIVFAAKRYGLAGATVKKGIMGFGSSSSVHYIKFWEFTEKIPVVVEIIDEAEKIDSFVQTITPWFELISYGCLITTEKANIVLYKTGKRKKITII
jgi:PII-like signaling protein